MQVWTGFIWLRVETGVVLLWAFIFRKMAGISSVAEQLLDFQN
jgi:hypothetical protein